LGGVPRPRALLDTAALVRAFAPDGLHGTPIERVAEACRVAKPTLYARGGDKAELFALALEAELERLLSRLSGPAPALAQALDEHLREAPDGMRLLLVTGRSPGSLQRVVAALGGGVQASVLLGAAYCALHGGPPVADVARVLPAGAESGPPAGIWTA
jgi:AcrR family transcriptional regulator